ncbi:hypothetical protein FRX31_002427, partial [Thalictrum thalictroides]
MWIQEYSKVEEIPEDNVDIPKFNFIFTNYNEVPSYQQQTKKNNGFDVMGRLELCSDPVPRMARGKSTKIRHVFLKNERGEELKVQLWGNLRDDIEEAVEMKKRGKTTNIILTCLMSNNWN